MPYHNLEKNRCETCGRLSNSYYKNNFLFLAIQKTKFNEKVIKFSLVIENLGLYVCFVANISYEQYNKRSTTKMRILLVNTIVEFKETGKGYNCPLKILHLFLQEHYVIS